MESLRITYGAWHTGMLLLPLLLIGCVGIGWYVVQLRQVLAALASATHRELMLCSFSWSRVALRWGATALGLLVIWYGLLRPQYPLRTPEKYYEYGRDLVVAIDISRSMLVADLEGQSRLEAAKKKSIALAAELGSERVALVVFAGAALVHCPLTKDGAAFRLFVESLDTATLSGAGTTSLGAALRAAITLFDQTSSRAHKLVLMLTDGEDFSSDFEEAQREAEKAGLLVSVLGVGSAQGGPIPLYDAAGIKQGYQKDDQGNIVISRLREATLRSLVERHKGLYVPLAGKGTADLQKLLEWVRQRERERGEGSAYESKGELAPWCAAIALCLWGVAWLG